MNSYRALPVAFISSALLLCVGCGARIDPAEHEKEIMDWRAGRIERLTRPTGWLTLVGLYWFRDGDNSFGRSTSNALVLDHPAMPDTLGTFTSRDGHVTFTASPASAVTAEGARVQSTEMAPDSSGKPTILAIGSLEFFVVERAGQLGLRVRDTEHAARKNFKGIEYFPISADWRFDAKFEAHEPARQVEIVNVLGMTDKMVSPGTITFAKDGKEYRLETILELPDDDELFIMFADATTARETYGAGRYLYIPMPKNGRTTIDFNKAYNPPCAFNDFATCPLPPQQNRLALRVEAGEKKYVREQN